MSSVPNPAPNIYVRHELMPFSGSSLILWSSKIQGRGSVKCQWLQQDRLQEEGDAFPLASRAWALAEMEKCRLRVGMRTGSPTLCSHQPESRTSSQGDHRKSMATLCQWRGERGQQPARAKRAAAQWFTLEGSVTFWSLQRIHMFDITITLKYFFLLDPMLGKIKKERRKCH